MQQNSDLLNPEFIFPVENPLPENAREVWIDGSMGRLYGLLQLPELPENGKCPMVIFCHCFMGNLFYLLWEPIIRNINAHGIGALRFDFNGQGKSDGEFVDMTVPNEIDDLMNVVSWVRRLPQATSISIVGHSQGGVVSGVGAGACGYPQIARLALLSPAAVLRDDALRGNSQGAMYDPWHLDKASYRVNDKFSIGRPYIQTAMNLPIFEQTARYHGKTLIMNGMADHIAPYPYAERYHKEMKDSELLLVPGENHVWTVNPAYPVKIVSDWLARELADRRHAL